MPPLANGLDYSVDNQDAYLSLLNKMVAQASATMLLLLGLFCLQFENVLLLTLHEVQWHIELCGTPYMEIRNEYYWS